MDIIVDASKNGEKYKPYWKKLITAGRAAEGLRDDWRRQLREVQKEIGFEYIRFHGIFHDDMMIYHEKEDGTPYCNWQYFDSLFDFLREVNLWPFLELSFMPAVLKTGESTVFWWKGNITPPKDYGKWAWLVKSCVEHCVERYGLNEVLKWYFEVWNEPNLYKGFWDASQDEYFKLYKITAEAIKSVDNRLKVGGPATSNFEEGKAPWVEDFIAFCAKNNVPLDFISTHPYPNQWPFDSYGNKVMGYRDENSTYQDLKWLRKTIDNSMFKNAEIHLTEWNSSPSPRDFIHDTAFMAPFIIQNNIKCLGLVDSLGFWTFTDIFEEEGAGDTLFHGGFGLINFQGIKKPSFYGYWFLSRLGDEKLCWGDSYFVARKEDKIQILMWNYCHYNEAMEKGDRSAYTYYDRYSVFKDKEIPFNLKVIGLNGTYKVTQYLLDRDHGSAFDVWLKNGALENPTVEEINILNKKVGPDVNISVEKDIVEIDRKGILKPHGVLMIEIKKM